MKHLFLTQCLYLSKKKKTKTLLYLFIRDIAARCLCKMLLKYLKGSPSETVRNSVTAAHEGETMQCVSKTQQSPPASADASTSLKASTWWECSYESPSSCCPEVQMHGLSIQRRGLREKMSKGIGSTKEMFAEHQLLVALWYVKLTMRYAFER